MPSRPRKLLADKSKAGRQSFPQQTLTRWAGRTAQRCMGLRKNSRPCRSIFRLAVPGILLLQNPRRRADPSLRSVHRERDDKSVFRTPNSSPLICSSALIRAREVEISYSVIRGSGEPDAALRVEEKFAHHGFGMWEGIFSYFSGNRVQPSDQILFRGCIPNCIVFAHSQRMHRGWRRDRATDTP